jgi:hypothetical protein
MLLTPISTRATELHSINRTCITPPVIVPDNDLSLSLIRLADRYRIYRSELGLMSLSRQDFYGELTRVLGAIAQLVEMDNLRLTNSDLRLIHRFQQSIFKDIFHYDDHERPWLYSIGRFYPLKEILAKHDRDLDGILRRYNLSVTIEPMNDRFIQSGQSGPRIQFARKLNVAIDQLNELFAVKVPENWSFRDKVITHHLQEFYSSELGYLRSRLHTPEATSPCQEIVLRKG